MSRKLRAAIRTFLEQSMGRTHTLIVDDGSKSICTACGKGGVQPLMFKHAPDCAQQAYWKARAVLEAAITPKKRGTK